MKTNVSKHILGSHVWSVYIFDHGTSHFIALCFGQVALVNKYVKLFDLFVIGVFFG